MVFIGGLLHLHTIHSYSAAHGETLANQAELRCAAQQEIVELDKEKKLLIPKHDIQSGAFRDTGSVGTFAGLTRKTCLSVEDVFLAASLSRRPSRISALAGLTTSSSPTIS